MSHDVETIALAANCLIVIGRTTDAYEVTDAIIEGPQSPISLAIQAYCGFELPTERDDESDGDAFGFILACPLDFDASRSIGSLRRPLGMEIRSGGEPIGAARLEVRSLADPRLQGATRAIDLLCEELAPANPALARILGSIAKGEHRIHHVRGRLEDHVVAPGIGVVAAGWTESLSEHRVVFLLDEFRYAVDPELVFLQPRRDLPKEIAERGRGSDAAVHAFTILDSIGGERTDLRLASVSSSQVQWSPPLEINRSGNVKAMMKLLAARVPARELMQRSGAAATIQRLVAHLAKSEATATIQEQRSADHRPDLSIIVPFYRDDFFLIDHLESQRRTDANAEWIFVSDDPSLNPRMESVLRARRESLRKPTKLILLNDNVGYARANNLAFLNAASEYVAFMNSDIYWRSFAPIEYGVKLLKQDETIGVVGFVLRFEDETIQHAGMRFEAIPEFDDLILTSHDGKGLPAPPFGPIPGMRDVHAVTGALMLVRRGDFSAGVFDEGFVGGDFEDGDLCLRMRARGKRIVLVECDGIYHLERQSIRMESGHSLFSYMNAVRFTTRWRDGGKSSPEPTTRADQPSRATGAASSRAFAAKSWADDSVIERSAVHVHLFYPDLVDEIFSYLDRSHLHSVDTYITVCDQRTLSLVDARIRSSGRSNISAVQVPNAGRDLAPLFIHQRKLFNAYDYVCHLHGKKSPHTAFGAEWRRYLIEGCVGSDALVRSVLGHMDHDRTVGVAFPQTYFRVISDVARESNIDRINGVLQRIDPSWRYRRVLYPAGSMCWLRTAAFADLLDRFPPLSAFEREDGRIDGTLAHALERCLTLIPALRGYSFLSYPTQLSANLAAAVA